MARIADPNNEICPECGERYTTIFDCIVNGFYHDIVFVHMGYARINIGKASLLLPNPRFCGRFVNDNARIDVDPVKQIVRITE